MASFRGADLQGAQLQGADLKECDFSGTNLAGANLGRNNLGGSTSVQGANFLDACLSNVVWEGVAYDGQTVFPKDFDPRRHGLIVRKA